jgi:phosphatidylserine/phosphatidylglycerophosphate/cardiolipin synthase-like enzyme
MTWPPDDRTLMWLQMGTGFMAALTLLYWLRWLARRWGHALHVTALFSPKGGCVDALVAELKKARKEILVQAYSFTSDPLTFALVDAKKRGVDVEVILDKSNEVERYSDLNIFLDKGLAPLIDSEHAIAHNKIMIIDRKVLVTGSFNFTNQAENQNAENLLIIKGHKEMVQQYRQNFLVHKEHSKPAVRNTQENKPAQPHTPERRAA